MRSTILTTTFSDMFKKSFLNNFAQESSPLEFIMTLAVALLIGLGIGFLGSYITSSRQLQKIN